MLSLKHVKKDFKTGNADVKAVNDVTLAIETGVFASIVGKSGSGKTTLLSLIGALDKPSSGSIVVDGNDITVLRDHALIAYRRKKIGFVFQQYNLILNLTALENVMLPMEFDGVPKAERSTRAKKLLKEVGLGEDKQGRKPMRLSGGEQQRVSIARALANNPSVILADEPTGNLDSNTSSLIVDLLKELARTKKITIIVVTHDLALAKLADKTFHLHDGKLIKKEERVLTKSI